MKKIYSKIESINGSVITVRATDVKYGELAEIEGEIAKLKIKLNRDNQRLNNYRYKNGMSTEGENAENLVPTSMLLQRFKDDDGALDNLIKTYHEILTNEDVKESVPNLLEQISSIYTKIKTDGGLVQDFGELKMAEQALINYIDKISELNTDGVEPLVNVLPISNVLREDEVVINEDAEEKTIANGPAIKDNMFVVPKTV